MKAKLRANLVTALALVSMFGAAASCATESLPAASDTWHKAASFSYRLGADAKIKALASDKLEVSAGDVLLEVSKPCLAITPLSHIHIKRKALVLVRVAEGKERLLVFCDAGLGAVSIACGKYKARLGPGDEALVTNFEPQYHDIVASDTIGRRRLRMHSVGGGKHLTTSEFSLLQAIERTPLINDVCHSGDSHDRDLREKILKTAAVLSVVTRSHGLYSRGARY